MLIVAIDTSGQAGGITLVEDDAHSFRVLESAPISGGTFSAQLVPVLASMLQRHNLQPSALGGLIAVSGPGSFTGLRVGLSAVKGLAEVLKRPIAVVSLLEALATQADAQGTVAAALDPGRNEVFLGLYTVSAGSAVRVQERLLSREEFASVIQSASPVVLVTRDAGIAEIAAGLRTRIRTVPRPSTELVATMGLRKLLAGG